ncbi:hypothetical protein JTB14_017894 [Gonioctena quinquepunctata]|nr:hypothetical protein JTB14_017894 [Gonioctena quinquepunctata]
MLNRVHNHKKLDLKKDSSMKHGDIVQFSSEEVALVKLKDNRAVLMAFNCTGGDQTSSIPKWDKKSKQGIPPVVVLYLQKTRKWTVKGFIQFTDLAVVNAWRQYKNDCTTKRIKPKDLLWFRVDLTDALMNCVSIPQIALEDEDPSSSKDRLFKRYRPAIPPSFDKRYDKHNHLPAFDDLTRGRKCRLLHHKSSLYKM